MSDQIPEEVKQKAAAKAAYVKQLIRFCCMLVILLVINLLTSPHYLWVLWVAVFGVLGFAIRGVKLFGGIGQVEEKLQRHFEKKEMEKRGKE